MSRLKTVQWVDQSLMFYDESKYVSLRDGGLSDEAPPTLDLMGMDKPQEMTGKSLLKGR